MPATTRCAWRPRSSSASACSSPCSRSSFAEALQDDLFGGSATLYWILIAAVLFYAASYFARGYLAGHRRYRASTAGSCSWSPLALSVRARRDRGDRERADGRGAGHGRRPALSLVVVPVALTRRIAPARRRARRSRPRSRGGGRAPGEPEFTLSRGTGFAAGGARHHAGGADLPERRAAARSRDRGRARRSGGRVRLQRAAARTGAARAVPGRADVDPPAPDPPLGRRVRPRGRRPLPPQRERDARGHRRLRRLGGPGDARGWAVADGPGLRRRLRVRARRTRAGVVAMGLYLSAATINQALLAQGRARQAATCWVGSAAGFVAFLFVSPVDDPVLSVEVACSPARRSCAPSSTPCTVAPEPWPSSW